MAAANGSEIVVDGEAMLKWKQNGKKKIMKFLDADVKRPLGAATAVVDAGNTVVLSRKRSFIRNDESGEMIELRRRRGVFVWKVNVDDMDIDEEERKTIKKHGMDMEIGEVDDSMEEGFAMTWEELKGCLLYTSPSPRDQRGSRMPSSA